MSNSRSLLINQKNRFLWISFVFLLVAFILMCVVFTKTVERIKFYYSTDYDGTYAITGGHGYFEGDLYIPSTINGNKMRSVGDRAFMSQTGIDRIIISDGIESIGNDAFSGCSGVYSIKIPASVKHIGVGAFYINRPNYSGSISVEFEDPYGWHIERNGESKDISSSLIWDKTHAGKYLTSTYYLWEWYKD